MSYAKEKPSVNQIELHPYLTQDNLIKYCQKHEIVVTAFSPLGVNSYIEANMAAPQDSCLTDPVIKSISELKNKSAAQILLRWALQRNTALIVKTNKPERLAENLDLDFELTNEEIAKISALNKNMRFNDTAKWDGDKYAPIFD